MTYNIDRKREGYRERLHEGDIAYIVEGPNPYAPNKERPVVKKITVKDTHYEGYRRHYPFITRWSSLQEAPGETGLATSVSPRELFTAAEVARVISKEDGLLGTDSRPIDEIIADPAAMPLLAEALGAAIMTRMTDESMHHRHDPEY